MKHRLLKLMWPFAFMTMVALASTPAYGQGGGGTSPLSGVVVDSTGALIPGAAVMAKNDATGASFHAVSGAGGTFSIPALNPGTYTVTVSLAGFKQVVLKDVRLVAATPTAVRATLEVGGMEETVLVEGASQIVQSQSAAISTTLEVNQISNLPLTSRNALDFIPSLPGVSTPGQNRDSIVSGLPQSTINITIDGMSVQDNHLKSTDGFFARISPRLDAVEEVTVTTAAQGAESAGQGAVQIRFITRSGTNDYHGSLYHYFRHHSLNANTWFNNRAGLPRAGLVQHQPGFRLGGPIIVPGLWDGRDKGFFFINYEELRQPTDVTRNRTVLHPRAQQGIFRYNVTVGGQTQVREVNLLELAARNGHISTVDPTTAKLLADIRTATGTKGSVSDLTDPVVQRYTFQNRQRAMNRYPLARLDFNLSDRHRLSGIYNYQHIDSNPDTLNNQDPFFPAFPITATQDSDRYMIRGSLRSTFGANVVNEFAIGGTGGATRFSKEKTIEMWSGTPVADQGGFHLNINNACCGSGTANTGATGVALSNAGATPTPSSREASTRVVENTLNWVKGSHSLQFGAAFTQADLWLKNQNLVPEIRFGVLGTDPADAMFNATNFPGASAANLAAARGLYAILVGRVSEIRGVSRLDENGGQYVYSGPGIQRGRIRELDLFAQDSWRVRPNLTLNYGLRYALQLPFRPLNDSYTTGTIEDLWGVSGVGNLFKPGLMTGRQPQFGQFGKGRHAYDTDWNNLAPSLGFAWAPKAETGWLRRILGAEGDTVIRAGYAMSYNRPGMAQFSDVFGNNPGVSINTFRQQALGNLGTLPVLFRDRGRLGPPPFQTTPVYPLTESVTEDINIFEPNLQVPYSQSWSLGIQRAIGRNMAVEARYIGTRFLQGWTEYDYNEINIIENGFLDEFKLAQANLQANIAAGRGSNFRYFGPGTGTFPLPIFLAYLGGFAASRAGDPSLYTSSQFGSNTFLTPLARFHPQPHTAADALDADATRRANALRAGLPANFLVANPDLLGGADLTGNGAYTRYDALEVELRRRFSRGFGFQASYVFGKAYESDRYSLRKPRVKEVNAGGEGGVTHAFKANWIWELPLGRNKRLFGDAGGVLDRIVGGWSLGGTARIQSGRMLDFGNVRLVGFTRKDLQRMFKLRFADDGRVYTLPQDVIDNTVKAWSVSATSPTGYGPLGPPSGRYFAPANGPDCIEVSYDMNNTNGDIEGFGDCGARSVIVTGPTFKLFDLSLVKKIPINGRVNLELRAELLNAFNHVNFTPVTGVDDDPDAFAADAFEVIAAQSPSGSTFDTGRIVQLVTRITW